MERVPPTKKTDLEKLDEQIEEEAQQWHRMGMHPNMTVHSNESVWVAKMQLQAMINTLTTKGLLTEDEINLEFKKLILADMKNMRAQAEQQKLKALVPDVKLLDKDGKPFKL